MKFDYKLELNKILENIYKEMMYNVIVKNQDINFSKDNIDKIKYILTNERVYLGNDMDEFILENIPSGLNGDLFRCSISQFHNTVHPRFVNYKGEPLKNSGYSRFALLLWEEHMNKLLIEDIQGMFTQEGFTDFVNNNLENHFDELNNRFYSKKSKTITIKFDKKEFLLNVVKSMIVKNELDLDYAHMLVDMDKLRTSMTESAATFDMYNEFDKLEDDTRYCLDNFSKYDTFELYDFLVNEQGFELTSEGILTKNI
jgi:hypothetical protein